MMTTLHKKCAPSCTHDAAADNSALDDARSRPAIAADEVIDMSKKRRKEIARRARNTLVNH